MTSVQRNVQDNPLQMAALGAAIAYPAWGLLRAIPTPLLLIGAGLFLTTKRGQQSAKDVTEKLGDVVQLSSDALAEAAGSVRSELTESVASVRSGAEQAVNLVASTAAGMTDRARTALQNATETVKQATDGGKIATAATADVHPLKNRTADAATSGRDAISEFVRENPLWVVGIGAALGAFIAASLPTSDSENKLFGAGSDKLKNKMREAAAEGIDKASDIAADAASSVATAAAREGLDAAGVREALNTVANTARAVADRGLDTALGKTAQPDQHPISERNAP